MKSQITVGIMAHVDAGKTTLSEAMLYINGITKTLGRVDHKNAYLDNFALERKRGITIFSKQAVLSLDKIDLTLLDTPGHVDFSTEMERSIQVMDYAILVISGTDGVQSHTETLWKLLKRYNIPVFIFVNKMDLDGADKNKNISELREKLSENCIDFGENNSDFYDDVAMCDEQLMEQYLNTGEINTKNIAYEIQKQKIFPCFFGSALHVDGVEEFLNSLQKYLFVPKYPNQFGAKVYKISRDSQGNRLTCIKVTGGHLSVKTNVTSHNKAWTEKIDQIRIYSGTKFKSMDTVYAGCLCAVTGLTKTKAGQGIGIEKDTESPYLEPVLNYQILLPKDAEPYQSYLKLRELEEEDPQLHIVWNKNNKHLYIQLMGQVQLEVLKDIIAERYNINVTFGTGAVVYKETIKNAVIGIGHFEPLRHYAEVHLLLEPLEEGTGLIFDTVCPQDVLDLNWQRLIMTHLEEKEHLGVLTGSPITDMKITVLTGKAHIKHTEGGDFRQATYRAIRQGLMQSESVLLEPWYNIRFEVPSENMGRTISDVQQMYGTSDSPQWSGNNTILNCLVPVATVGDYQQTLLAYTKGKGKMFCSAAGYKPCHNSLEIIEKFHYNPENDVENTPDSVFCSHGAGTIVKWDKVKSYAHLDSGNALNAILGDILEENKAIEMPVTLNRGRVSPASEQELISIFEKTYGSIKQYDFMSQRKPTHITIEQYSQDKINNIHNSTHANEYVLVDGYNIIFAWDELKNLAQYNLNDARESLIEIMCNYQGIRECNLILVFDAYKVPDNPGNVEKIGNIHVVYTKHAETADMYIEKVTYQIAKHSKVRVATSDGLEQVIILGHGATRVSARMFRQEVLEAEIEIKKYITKFLK